ncbi:hypothetical protein I4U23_022580 [Adineta vaga]|nr:hypothetical protein I4U23_022580 [Adineta vaga]
MRPGATGSFSIIVSGPTNTSFKRIINPDKCVIGSSCNTQKKGIGVTLDDILRYEINRNMILNNQPLLVKISVALIMIMFIMGLINSILSFLTFQNANLRKRSMWVWVCGCGCGCVGVGVGVDIVVIEEQTPTPATSTPSSTHTLNH